MNRAEALLDMAAVLDYIPDDKFKIKQMDAIVEEMKRDIMADKAMPKFDGRKENNNRARRRLWQQ